MSRETPPSHLTTTYYKNAISLTNAPTLNWYYIRKPGNAGHSSVIPIRLIKRSILRQKNLVYNMAKFEEKKVLPIYRRGNKLHTPR